MASAYPLALVDSRCFSYKIRSDARPRLPMMQESMKSFRLIASRTITPSKQIRSLFHPDGLSLDPRFKVPRQSIRQSLSKLAASCHLPSSLQAPTADITWALSSCSVRPRCGVKKPRHLEPRSTCRTESLFPSPFFSRYAFCTLGGAARATLPNTPQNVLDGVCFQMSYDCKR